MNTPTIQTRLLNHAPRCGLALLSSCLYFLGFCGFGYSWLSWFCLVPILWALDSETLSTSEASVIAGLFGLGTHMGGYWWLVNFFESFAHLPLGIACLLYTLLCLAQGSLLGAWALSVYGLERRFSIPKAISAAPMMILFEWGWPALFPSYLANSLYLDTLMVQAIELTGPLGLSGLLTLSSALIYQLIAWRVRGACRPIGLGMTFLVLLAGQIGFGIYSINHIEDLVEQAPKSIKVGLAQTNMGIYEKRKDPAKGVRRHLRMSLELEERGADLIVWPESGYQYPIPARAKNVKKAVLSDLETPLLFGGLRLDQSQAKRTIYNTAFLTNAQGDIEGTYDKVYLLAFGEYIPFGDTFPWLYTLSPHTSRFSQGTHTRPLELDGIKFGILICYEDILPGFVREVMAHRPHVLVNLTNDAWFGDTHEPIIHLALTTFRAIEHRRYIVRSTNTGISALIDPLGRIIAQTATFEEATLLEEIKALDSPPTLYASAGDWVGWCSLIWLLICIWRARKKLSEPHARS